jgi:hypothetical protein
MPIRLLITLVVFLFFVNLIFHKEKPRNYYSGEEIDLVKLSVAIADTWENEYLK